MLGRLKKLKSRTTVEIRTRAFQELSVLVERLGFGSGPFYSSVGTLSAAVNDPNDQSAAAAALVYFRNRREVPCCRSFENRESTVSEFLVSFPEDAAAAISTSERILRGRFDLLGYKDLYFDGVVPRWNFDPDSGGTVANQHWSKLDKKVIDQTADRKVIWELNRHQFFVTLGQAYWLTSDERYAKHFARLLNDWIAENEPKMGINWQSSLEVSFRSISWIWAFYFFKDSPHFDAATFARMLRALCISGRHISTYLSTYSSPNTHLTGEALGLYQIGRFLSEFDEARSWKTLGYEILLRALDFQIRADGVYCEQATHYHRYTTDFYTTLLVLRTLDGEPVDPIHLEKLNQLFDHLMYVMQPNGELPLLGDDDGGLLHFIGGSAYPDIRPTMAVGAALLKRGDLKFVSGRANSELLWLLGVDGLQDYDNIEPHPPSDVSRDFSASGYYCARSSWSDKADYMVVDCGPHGFLNGGHAHADALSFVMAIAGEPVFVDSGTYKYASDIAARDTFRSTQSHNCLAVNDGSSSVPDGPWSWNSMAACTLISWRGDEEGATLRGRHDGFQRYGVQYERSVEFKFGRHVVVTDNIVSSSKNIYQVHFILSPDWLAEIKGESVEMRRRTADSTLIVVRTRTESTEPLEKFEWAAIPWFVSKRYGSKAESTKLVLTVAATGDLRIINEMFIGDSRPQNLQEKG
jgi:hypothetical protein